MTAVLNADVVVVGSGAGGSAVAGELAAGGLSVVVVEAGPQWFEPAGTHIRTVYDSEADLSKVGDMIYGELLCNPSNEEHELAAIPNLKVAHGVGGMFALWMGNCPYPDEGELPDWLPYEKWKPYFDRATEIMHVDQGGGGDGPLFEELLSRASTCVGELAPGREPRPMPIAARRVNGKLKITASDDLFFRGGDSNGDLKIVPDTIVQRILTDGGRATGVEGSDRNEPGKTVRVEADFVVVAAGTVGSAKLVAGTGLDAGPALGRYIHEHSCIGSRVTLKPDIRELVRDDEPVYSIWIPYSKGHEWQNQLCRFTLASDGQRLAPGIREVDTSDIFTFVGRDVVPDNRLIFDTDSTDPFGLPKMSAEFGMSRADRERSGSAMAEHFLLASEIGDLASGWNMSLYPAGGSTHFMGSCRMGPKDDDESVVDVSGRLWRYDNIFLAGNAVLPTSNAGNPTLTAVAQSLRTADRILAGR